MRSHRTAALLVGCLSTFACISTKVDAQRATAAPTHVALQNEVSNGTTTQSGTYVLDGAFGAGVTARRTTSASYVLSGGFTSALDTPPTGKPWLTSVLPDTATLRGQAPLSLRGTELDLGTAPTVRIGGVVAQVIGRSRDSLTTTLPLQPEPGWLPVEFTNNLGTTVLPRGIGVLPLIETSQAAASDVAFDMIFRGTQGDRIIWAIGIGQGPPIILPGAHFGFALTPPNFIVFSGLTITATDGTIRVPFQGTTYPTGLIYLQALFLSTNVGYAPATFSNILRI